MSQLKQYILPGTFSSDDFSEKIEFTIKEKNVFSGERIYFDTFDRRLYKKNLLLCKDNNSYVLEGADNGTVIGSAAWRRKRNAVFLQDFPPGKIRKKLDKLIEARALLRLEKLAVKTIEFNFVNSDNKIVVNLLFESVELKNTPDFSLKSLTLTHIKGCNDEFYEFEKLIKKFGGVETSGYVYLPCRALESQGKLGYDYSSKLNIKLPGDSTCRQAAVVILKSLLKTMRQNKNKIKNNIDIEFLHDFRIAARRTRVVLTETKGVFPREMTDCCKKEFVLLGKLTNKVRDYDVFLLNRDNYNKMLPENLKQGMNRIFNYIKRNRKKEYEKIKSELESTEYKNLIENWNNELEKSPELPETVNSKAPALEFAKKNIFDLLEEIINKNKNIKLKTKDIKIHSLRINCKKLRYMLEFFRSLLDKKEVKPLLSSLKKLQDNLGEFNDVATQINLLNARFEYLSSKKYSDLTTVAAVGGLLSVLQDRKLKMKKRVIKVFAEFSRKSTCKIFKKQIFI